MTKTAAAKGKGKGGLSWDPRCPFCACTFASLAGERPPCRMVGGGLYLNSSNSSADPGAGESTWVFPGWGSGYKVTAFLEDLEKEN